MPHNTASHSDLAELAVDEDLNDKEAIEDEDLNDKEAIEDEDIDHLMDWVFDDHTSMHSESDAEEQDT